MTQEDVQVVNTICGTITAVFAPISAAIAAYAVWKIKQVKSQGDNTINQVAQVKHDLIVSNAVKNEKLDTLDRKADINQATTDKALKFIDGAMEVSLREKAEALRELAVLKPNDGIVSAEALAAEKALENHVAMKANSTPDVLNKGIH